MKKEEIITAIIIILIIISNIISQNYSKKCINETNDSLSRLKAEAIDNSKTKEEFIEEINNIYDIWEEKNEILSYYIEHDELEKVNTQIRATKAYFEADLTDDAIPEIEKGIYVLEHIKEKQAFNLKNIF